MVNDTKVLSSFYGSGFSVNAFRSCRVAVVFSMLLALSLTGSPAASAEPSQPSAVDTLVTEDGMYATELSMLATIINDIFSCKHRPALPWCR